jgi:multidrug efflux system membrane fusion protein
MLPIIRNRVLAGAAAIVALLVAGVGIAADRPQAASAQRPVETGITKPADLKPRELRFKTLGQIRSVSVKEGDAVRAGQELMTLDDAEEQNELEILQLDASKYRVEAAVIQEVAKRAEFDRIKKLKDQGSGNESEFEKAEAEWKLSQIQITQEKQDLLVKEAKVKKQQGIIDRMKLRSPIDGIVQSIDSHTGETVDPSKPAVMTIVTNNPLVVEVNLPTATSTQLTVGQPLRVSYDKKEWREAKIGYLAPMADAASGYQTVHLTLANPEGRASGLQIFVELPEPIAAAR